MSQIATIPDERTAERPRRGREAIAALAGDRPHLRADDLVSILGLPARGAAFLISKLKREGRV